MIGVYIFNSFNIKNISRIIILLLVIIILCLLATPVLAKASNVTDDDVYIVDLEWGSMIFTYDYGTWSTTDYKYIKDDSSCYPAIGTQDGCAGWYGFDGTANMIKVVNRSRCNTGLLMNIDINITGIDGVSSMLYSDYPMTTLINTTAGVAIPSPNNSLFTQQSITRSAYLSLSGEPVMTNDGEYFQSLNPTVIGGINIIINVQ